MTTAQEIQSFISDLIFLSLILHFVGRNRYHHLYDVYVHTV